MFFFTSHLQKSPGHMLRLTCKAKYGYEYLYVELSKQFNMKVNKQVNVIIITALVYGLSHDHLSVECHANVANYDRIEVCEWPHTWDSAIYSHVYNLVILQNMPFCV